MDENAADVHMRMVAYMEAQSATLPNIVEYARYMNPYEARRCGYPNEFVIFPVGYFEQDANVGSYERERDCNMHKNTERMIALGLDIGKDIRFLKGQAWSLPSSSSSKQPKKKRKREREEDVGDDELARATARAAVQEGMREAMRTSREPQVRASSSRKREERAAAREAAKRLKAERAFERAREREERRGQKRRERGETLGDKSTRRRRLLDNEAMDVPVVEGEAMPWARPVPMGIACLGTGEPVCAVHLPMAVLEALAPLVAKLRAAHRSRDWMTGEWVYKHVARETGGSQQTVEHYTFRGHKVQRNGRFLARTQEAYTGAVVAAASMVDSRLDSQVQAQGWLLWMAEEGSDAAHAWLSTPAVQVNVSNSVHWDVRPDAHMDKPLSTFERALRLRYVHRNKNPLPAIAEWNAQEDGPTQPEGLPPLPSLPPLLPSLPPSLPPLLPSLPPSLPPLLPFPPSLPPLLPSLPPSFPSLPPSLTEMPIPLPVPAPSSSLPSSLSGRSLSERCGALEMGTRTEDQEMMLAEIASMPAEEQTAEWVLSCRRRGATVVQLMSAGVAVRNLVGYTVEELTRDGGLGVEALLGVKGVEDLLRVFPAKDLKEAGVSADEFGIHSLPKVAGTYTLRELARAGYDEETVCHHAFL